MGVFGDNISRMSMTDSEHKGFRILINGDPLKNREGVILDHGHNPSIGGISGQHTFPDLLEIMEALYDRVGVVPTSRPIGAVRPAELREMREAGLSAVGGHVRQDDGSYTQAGGDDHDHDHGDGGHSH